jgi:diguanylate cyclase (GGDEF)-like protein/PAS domain S-box-containing protein
LLAVAYVWVRRSIEALLAAGGAGDGARALAVSGPRELHDATAAFNQLFEKLRLSDERFRLIGQATNDAVWDWDLLNGTVWWNANFQGLFGYTPDQIEPGPESWTGRLHPEDAARVQAGIERMIRGSGSTWSDEYRFRRGDGSYADIFDRGFIIRDADGRAVRMLGAMQDVSERRQQQQRIERLSRMRRVMSSINALIVRTRSRAELFQEACRVAVEQGGFGLAWIGVVRESGDLEPVAKAGADDGYVRRLRFRVDGSDATACQPIVLAIREERPLRCNDIAGDDSLGAWRAPLRALGFASMVAFPLAAGNRIVGCFNLYSAERGFFDEEEMKLLGELATDLSYALEFIIKDEQLDFLSIYDPLTQLPNRTLFMRRLPGFIQAAQDSGRRLALLILDVERFKAINDALGQAGGDELLKRIGERLRFHAGGSGYMARVSGDRFAAVITDLAPDEDPERLVQRDAWDRLSPPFEYGGQEHLVTFKVGLAVYPQDGADAEALLRNAELALKHGKAGGGRLTRYTESIGTVAREKQRLNQELRLALERGELLLHYQPTIDLRSGAICGAEALLRWNSPERGLVPPGNFIALLEETGLILDVGAWVLERALAQREQWRREGLAVPRIGVNVSAVQLSEAGFVDVVARLLAAAPEISGGLELEITESVMMSDPEAGVARLRALRGLGVTLAMDDFGTGYSSLSYLARLPLNSLKIDRSFVVGMIGHADTLNIVAAIIALAHSMNLKVVAEGVESPEQVEQLRELGCDEVQGFLFSKPVPAEQFAQLLRGQRAL